MADGVRPTYSHTIGPAECNREIQVDRTQPKEKQATETETEAETEAG